MKVEIYSDVACPWCHVGKRRFERALEAFPGAGEVEVVYRPYQLDPQAPTTGIPLLQRLSQKYGANARAMAERVSAQAREEGIEMDFDRALAANTLDAHRLLRLAEGEHGAEVQHALAEALFQAHFSEGRDIADRAVLTELAGRAGMEAERARAYLDSAEGAAEVRAEIEQAQAMGISAVPTFVFEGKWAVQGAQPASAFLQALEAVQRETTGVAAEGGAEGCGDDGCAI